MSERVTRNDPSGEGFSRRQLVTSAAGGAVAVGFAGVLAACGGDSETSSTADGGKPSTGGSLRIGMVGAGPGSQLDPSSVVTLIAYARIRSLFEPLADFTREDPLVLASSMEPNSDNTTWQIKIQPDANFHDGKPVTATDVLYSYQRLIDSGAAYLPAIDLKRSRKVSDKELELALNYPVVDLVAAIFNGTSTFIVQDGAEDFKSPVGSGPFKFQSYSPGEESVFARNDDYWRNGLPYVDELVIRDIAEPTARMNALLAGQVDAVSELDLRVASGMVGDADLSSSGMIDTNDSNVRIINGAAGQWVPFCLNISSDEFSDPRVRQAFRLAMDREQAVETALANLGVVGNDLFGIGLPGYAESIEQRTYDPEQARSLLKAAGREGIEIELQTAPAGTAFVEAARVFASSAKAAGINIKVVNTPADSYYTDVYGQVPMFQTQWTNATLFDLAPATLLADAPYNLETGWQEPSWDKRFAAAQGESDETNRNELLQGLQQDLWDRGGYLIWAMPNWVDGARSNVNGIEASSRLALGAYQFENWWLS